MPWFDGEPLLTYLENVYVGGDRNLIDFRFPVQRVVRPDQDFRGYSGQVASGVVRPGDEIVVLPSGKRSTIARIVTFDGDLDYAFAPLCVTLCIEDDIDVSRGDMIVHPRNLPQVERSVEAMVEGEPDKIDEWITEIKEGPRYAEVVRIDQERREGAGPLGDFDVKF